jgi:hypothetical protein
LSILLITSWSISDWVIRLKNMEDPLYGSDMGEYVQAMLEEGVP